MAPTSTEPNYIGITGIQGRNGSDANFLIPDRQCLEAYNIDWFQSALGRKRPGSFPIGLDGWTDTTSNSPYALLRHVPGEDQSDAELWAMDGNLAFHRLAGSATWADPTTVDAMVGFPWDVNGVSFGGLHYLAYDSGVNRLHAWDPVTATIRRLGFAIPGTPSAGAPSAGAATDTRKYRVAFTVQDAGVTVRQSQLGVATGAVGLVAQQVVLTKPASPGEGETHWELYAASISSLYGDYRLIATTVVGTATATDNNATLPADVAPDDGANTAPPSCKYMVADDNRIIMAGAYETVAGSGAAPSTRRVWWTSATGSSSAGDGERVSLTGTINSYADVEESITGLSQPLQLSSASGSESLQRGSFYVFSYRGQWKFVQTGDADGPYLRFRVTGGFGCIQHKTIVLSFDANGDPALYWLSPVGPVRRTAEGQQFLGEDLADIWPTVNLDATIVAHAVAHHDLHQVWFYVATGSSTVPNLKLVFDTRLGHITETTGVRGGWSVHEGVVTSAFCSCMFSDDIGASMSNRLKPFVGVSTTNTVIAKCDQEDLDDDYGNVYQAYIDSKSYAPWGLNRKGGMSAEALLIADPSPGTSIQLSIYRNEGAEIIPSKADLTDLSDTGEADSVFAIFEDSRLADSYTFRCRIGDAAAVSSRWNLDALIVPLGYQGDH